MLSEDQTGPVTLKPSVLDVRKHDTVTHAFKGPVRMQAFAQSDTGSFEARGREVHGRGRRPKEAASQADCSWT